MLNKWTFLHTNQTRRVFHSAVQSFYQQYEISMKLLTLDDNNILWNFVKESSNSQSLLFHLRLIKQSTKAKQNGKHWQIHCRTVIAICTRQRGVFTQKTYIKSSHFLLITSFVDPCSHTKQPKTSWILLVWQNTITNTHTKSFVVRSQVYWHTAIITEWHRFELHSLYLLSCFNVFLCFYIHLYVWWSCY